MMTDISISIRTKVLTWCFFAQLLKSYPGFQFFFTSPPLIISQLEVILNIRDLRKSLNVSDKMNDFLPTLMLW